MAELNPREELISLMRGLFACPVIATLGKHGMIKRMLQGPFQIEEFKVSDPDLLEAVFRYLVALGLVKVDKPHPGRIDCEVTELGRKVLSRFGSFVLLNSYRSFAVDLDRMLTQDLDRARCNRWENVVGSGLTNSRRFFPAAMEMLDKLEKPPYGVIDIACGDGTFLAQMIERYPGIKAGAVDLSSEALEGARERLRKRFPWRDVTMVASDARSVAGWAEHFQGHLSSIGEGVGVISMWFLIHEIAAKKAENVVEFLKHLRYRFNGAHLIIGEIVAVPPQVLAEHRHGSAMPEFLLFHDASHQGVLDWLEWERVKEQIPYRVVDETKFDVMVCGKHPISVEIPSAFVWHLEPIHDQEEADASQGSEEPASA